MLFQRIRVGCSGCPFYGAARVVGVPGRLIYGSVESMKSCLVFRWGFSW